MILYYTQNSPFARIARIGLREGGLTGRVEERKAILRKPENPVLAHSPIGRVPTLVVDGVGVVDTGRIWACLAEAAGTKTMRPAAVGDIPALAFEGLVLGFLESAVAIRREVRRVETEQSPGIILQERERSERILAELERTAGAGRLPPLPAFAAAVLAVALEFSSFNGLLPGWEARFPRLGGWLEAQRRRESMVTTAFVPVE